MLTLPHVERREDIEDSNVMCGISGHATKLATSVRDWRMMVERREGIESAIERQRDT